MNIFSATTKAAHSAVTATWKPVSSGGGPGNDGAAMLGALKQTQTDQVSVSKLGQALTGVAADAFSHLNGKAKGFLENLVNSGKISADEVALGLRSAASEATFNRYVAERPQDEEDKRRLAASNAASDRMQTYLGGLETARVAFGAARDQLHEQQAAGMLSETGMQEQLAPLQAGFDAAAQEIDSQYGKAERDVDLASLGDNGGFAKNVNGFNAAMGIGTDKDGFISPTSSEGKAVGAKLFQLGFGPEMFGSAFDDFAATVDVPGIGRKSSSTASQAAPSAPTESATPVSIAPTGAADSASSVASPPSVGLKPTNADPGKAKAALSMLQDALESNGAGKKAGGILVATTDEEADAGIASLMETLKAGGPSSSPSVKIDS
ncbi:hypothetical protein ABNQ38_31995 [Azospirillum sp. A29]|uniref:hypothetical protein n=1 Tax=Azospirillum sp. A29 TaxID=3160606 RepID=UPI00366F080F